MLILVFKMEVKIIIDFQRFYFAKPITSQINQSKDRDYYVCNTLIICKKNRKIIHSHFTFLLANPVIDLRFHVKSDKGLNHLGLFFPLQ